MNITFNIPDIPPSVNNYWIKTKWGGVCVSKAGTAFKNLTYTCMRNQMRGLVPEIKESDALDLHVKVYGPHFWVTKRIDGVSTRRLSKTAGDVDNFLKCLLDSLSASLRFDDSIIQKVTVEKLHSNKRETFVTITKVAE